MFERALQLHQAGRIAEAEAMYRQILAQQPRHAEALQLLGIVMYQRGDLAFAADLIRQAIDVEPNVAFFHSNLAEILRAKGEAQAAEQAARRSIAIGESPGALHNLGLALSDQRKLHEAESVFRRAIALEPNDARSHNSLGAVLQRRGDIPAAIESYRRAIELDPKLADAHSNLGAALDASRDIEGAVSEFRTALSLDPSSAETRNNLADALRVQGMVDEAIVGFQESLRLRADLVDAASNLLYAMQFSPRFDAEAIFAAHRQWAARYAEPLTSLAAPHVAPRHQPLRVGYVSADLCDHPVGRFVLPALARRDRQAFRVTCYAGVTVPDTVTDQLKEACDAWRDVGPLSDAALADQIRTDEIDVLIDLSGHTAHNRLLAFARKPAPIQATYLGYPDTTGMRAIDFRITDTIADPPGQTERFHTERLIRLDRCAWCFVPPQNAPAIASPARDHVVFGSFNNLAKISSDTIEAWAKLLHAVPDARLVLKARGMQATVARERLRNLFSAQGIDPQRLELLEPTELNPHHLATYERVDIAVDTFPYAGTTTTCEALWMGVPVVTLACHRHAVGVGASLLTAAGLTELIGNSPDEYVEIAKSLAANIDRRHQLRSNLREMLKASALLDTTDFARHFDRALAEMATTTPRCTPAPEC